MNKEAMYKLSYGLFVLTAKEGKKDNGCIINTAIQAASAPGTAVSYAPARQRAVCSKSRMFFMDSRQ